MPEPLLDLEDEVAKPSARATHAFQVIRSAYGDLAEWRCWLRVADDPGGNEGADGMASQEPRYRKATITIRRGLSEQREREVIAHELAHILLGTVDQALNRIIDLVPEHQHEHAQELYSDGIEPVCERLAFAVLNLIPEEAWATP